MYCILLLIFLYSLTVGVYTSLDYRLEINETQWKQFKRYRISFCCIYLLHQKKLISFTKVNCHRYQLPTYFHSLYRNYKKEQRNMSHCNLKDIDPVYQYPNGLIFTFNLFPIYTWVKFILACINVSWQN